MAVNIPTIHEQHGIAPVERPGALEDAMLGAAALLLATERATGNQAAGWAGRVLGGIGLIRIMGGASAIFHPSKIGHPPAEFAPDLLDWQPIRLHRN